MEDSYCLCGQPYDPNIFMIQCDACKDWFHSSCCNFQEHLAVEIDRYHCPRCALIVGPSIFKPYNNWHRHDYWEENVDHKPVQTGTAVFIRELRARHFYNEDDTIVRLKGSQLTEQYILDHGFDLPIVIDNVDGLDMTIPPDSFTLYDIETLVGGDALLDVIDVTRQTDIKMKLSDYVEYFNSLNRIRVFNVISLEFSSTPLTNYIEAPLFARQLDWANTVWPKDFPVPKPSVQKYCLMSVKDSYTDFHIDFGGTSVWYHVLRGEKIFYFIKPTTANLTLYQQWMTSTNQSETFFGDQVDECFKCTLRQGQTMLIPTGWIHAVLTPIDSIVFGGNFLHSYNIPMQLSVYEMEKKMKTSPKFKYPNFEMICWFAAVNLYQQINSCNSQELRCPSLLLTGIKALLANLKQWNTEKDYNTYVRDQIPFTINSSKLLKDISKEIRHAERFINHLNPPKPERESKRKRKRPVNKDFDYSLSENELQINEKVEKHSPIKLTISRSSILPFDEPAPVPTPEPLQLTGTTWEPQYQEPLESSSIHRGGTLLKIRMGLNSQGPSSLESGVGTSSSVYDFHDDSDRDTEGNYTIDESPKKRKPKSKLIKSKREDLMVNQSAGIESLIESTTIHNGPSTSAAGASPSTQEAIAGMLSIGQTYVQPSTSKRGSKNYQHSVESDDEISSTVHQDDDYIYPSLDNSDEEDVHIFKPRGRTKVDEAWSPKARVGPLVPKVNRPAREGTKKQAVEKVLEAAAAKRASTNADKSPKRQYRKKKSKQKELKPLISVSSDQAGPSTSTVSIGTPSRMKKGMKTAKQRLGKILKLHKMRH